MRLRANRETCCGAGVCVVTAPRHFAHDDAGLVVVLEPHPDEADRVDVEFAVDACPTQSICLEES
jgi:ferredoxin